MSLCQNYVTQKGKAKGATRNGEAMGKEREGEKEKLRKLFPEGFPKNKARTKVHKNKLKRFRETQKKKLEQILNRNDW